MKKRCLVLIKSGAVDQSNISVKGFDLAVLRKLPFSCFSEFKMCGSAMLLIFFFFLFFSFLFFSFLFFSFLFFSF